MAVLLRHRRAEIESFAGDCDGKSVSAEARLRGADQADTFFRALPSRQVLVLIADIFRCGPVVEIGMIVQENPRTLTYIDLRTYA